MITITEEKYGNSLKHSLLQPLLTPDSVALWWLGQAGFAVRYSNTLIFIDPYLSDFLAKKYKGKEFPHHRMMEPPILPAEVKELDLVLCTHRHSDHLDPETVPILAKNNRDSLVIVPRADEEWGISVGIPDNQIRTLNAGERFSLADEITIEAIPAAHEDLKINEKGEHCYLGYIVTLGHIWIYHSGDCTPYPGLEQQLQDRHIDSALFPINGRDEYRRSRNIMGNFTLVEAVDLCKRIGISIMIGHHFGMFDFNTIDVEEAERELQRICGDMRYFLARVGVKYILSPLTTLHA
jgi:L-ascorbate metabolism protein UlaG (beta-lactamase superfamily)